MELSNDQIKQILPHRYPFLLVDKITECAPGEMAKGIKCVSANEMQFLGHFPEKSVFPGVLILEAMAQVGGIAILTLAENKGKLAFLGGMKNVKFRAQVVPGDVLEMECTMTRMMGNVGIGEAKAMVEGKLAASAEFTFALGE
ncbi:MAG: 3-hydroxyacyl-ACP dehydratase FabZ [Defluviitaleaceae bacterium]|nr:3-hydroxyacyl-ACP dehydratase FabZ [Defluviitaleaceae bacterium]